MNKFYYILEYDNIMLFKLLEINKKFDDNNIDINKTLTQDKKIDVNAAVTDNLGGLALELGVDLLDKADTALNVISMAGGPAAVGAKALMSKGIKAFSKKFFPQLFKNIKGYFLGKGKNTNNVGKKIKEAGKEAGKLAAEKEAEAIESSMKNIVSTSLKGKGGLYDYLNTSINDYHKERRKKILDNF